MPLVSLGVRCDPIYLSKDVPPLRPPHPRPHLTVDLLAVDVHDDKEPSRALRARAEARYTSWLNRVAADKSIS